MLFHFGRIRNGYVGTQFILSSTAESSSTNGYVVVPERFGQSEARASRNVERIRKKPSFDPSSGFNRCSMLPDVNMNFIHHFYLFYFMYFIYFRCIFINFVLRKICLIFSFCHYLFCRRGNKHFDLHFWRIGLVPFPSKDGKDAVHERRSGRRGVYFPPNSAFFLYSYCD